jgi:dynein heavy chain
MKLMKDTVDNIKPDKKSTNWLAYVDYVNGLVIEGITNAIDSSMADLAQQISIPYNYAQGLAPIFMINVCLDESKIQFEPTITCNEMQTGIRDIIGNIVGHFISLAIRMPQRLDYPQGGGDYLPEIKDQFQLYGAMQQITNNLNEIEAASNEFLDQYNDIAFMWEEELDSYFENFLKSGPDARETYIASLKTDETLEEEDLEEKIEAYDAMTNMIMGGVQTQLPALEIFDEKITHYHEVKNRIAQVGLKPQKDIGWIRVNSAPLIKDLQLIIEKWIEKFTSFLLENTNNQLKNTQNFIDDVKGGIKELPKGLISQKEKTMLTKVMTHLRDVSQIKDMTLESFPNLRNTIQLLKKHNVDVNAGQKADLLVVLENSRTDLVDTADKALGPVKEAILPLQGKESDNVKTRVRAFQLKVLEFRQDFTNKLPYHVTETSKDAINDAYKCIMEYYDKTNVMEAEAKELQHLESLFELQRTNQKELKDCKNELIQLKKMWDLISLIDMQFESWKKTLWEQINTDDMASLLKDIKTKQTAPNLPANKEIKGYKAFQSLGDRVKQMDLVGPMVSQLHSDNM